jgi:hypothetical protein
LARLSRIYADDLSADSIAVERLRSRTVSDNTRQQNPRNLAIVISLAFVASLGLFITVILPAEFGRDPLGTGRLLGLTNLAGTTADALNTQFEFHKTDEVEFILEPFQSLEYKYLMDTGNALVFSWSADGELYFDLHAENTTIADDEQSYAKGLGTQQMGAYLADFNGMHGWFWENRGFEQVTLRLKTSGFYVNATELRGGGSSDRSPSAVFE